MKRTTLLLTLLHFGSLAVAQPDNDLWNGHIAFGEGRYDEARAFYMAEIDTGNTWDWLPEIIATVDSRKQLGEIHPADTQRIGAIFLTRLHLIQNGDTTSSEDVTEDKILEWTILFQVMSRTIEAWSEGQFTLEFDTIRTESFYIEDDILKPDNPDHLALEKYFHRSMADFDSYVTFSNTRSPARGLARRYPYVHSEIYGPHRGMFAINAASHGYAVLLHEFFHTIEWVSGVANGVAHGYTDGNRINFPEWTGSSEYDYYKWHFESTIPDVGWRELRHSTRWIPLQMDTIAWQQVQDSYHGILLEDRLKADSLVEESADILNSDPVRAEELLNAALELSPLHIDGTLALFNYKRSVDPDPDLQEQLYSNLKLARAVEGWYSIGPENDTLGQVIQLWHPEDVPLTWDYRQWAISNSVGGPGCYDLAFYYTSGWDALQIDSVGIIAEGELIARDNHYGFSGTNKTDILYRLSVPSYSSNSEYLLEAKVYADGDTDSHGQIHIRTVEDLVAPDLHCPMEIVLTSSLILEDYTGLLDITDNCSLPTLEQFPQDGEEYASGPITFTATDHAGNSATCEVSVSVDVTTALPNQDLSGEIKVFPNPASGDIKVETTNLIKVILLDRNGRVLLQTSSPTIDGRLLKPGLYFVLVKTVNGSGLTRLVLE